MPYLCIEVSIQNDKNTQLYENKFHDYSIIPNWDWQCWRILRDCIHMTIDKQRQTKQKIGMTKEFKMLGKLSQDSNESIHFQILILIVPLIKTTTTLYIKQTIICKIYISLPPGDWSQLLCENSMKKTMLFFNSL